MPTSVPIGVVSSTLAELRFAQLVQLDEENHFLNSFSLLTMGGDGGQRERRSTGSVFAGRMLGGTPTFGL